MMFGFGGGCFKGGEPTSQNIEPNRVKEMCPKLDLNTADYTTPPPPQKGHRNIHDKKKGTSLKKILKNFLCQISDIVVPVKHSQFYGYLHFLCPIFY